MKAFFPLLALATGAFAIGATEFTPMGLLPNIASGLDISITTAGGLITGYAVGVMVGAPIMTLGLGRLTKRHALIFLLLLFIAGNLLASQSNSYLGLMIARLITSLNHGAFFGIGSVVAASLVEKHKQAAAVAAMFMGLTLSNLIGVPLMTWIGQVYGWRLAFILISGLGIVTLIGLLMLLPSMPKGNKPNIKYELKVLTRLPVVLALLTTVFGASALFALYTYIAPFLINIVHVSESDVAMLLIVIGLGFTVGNYLGGKLSAKGIDRTLVIFFVLLIVSMLILPLVSSNLYLTVITLFIWSAASFALVPPLQIKTMQIAHDAPGLVSSVNIGAFNLGNAIGAIIGGVALKYGYNIVPLSAALVGIVGLLLVFSQFKVKREPQNSLA
ncbi:MULTISPECIES: MFS transporter [Enterobacterales]|uniref:MFS transporter n=1 Tax=Enterobacterales TaxID=91347 RepID=UPI000847E768|nr:MULTISPECIES: MFS transporter [Enterobacterales]WOO48789.1 MFS transporter [Hafnia alvei]MCT6518866.1 MFS transporter [Proteus vulgaris]ODQ07038.1 MFS transporter [Shigella sp. FC130]OEI94433.1 MFS transporter [Shigella sp. FC1655]OEJ08852.1 MFS transporter [Shigella sp. FC1967]